ncbi:MAG: GNAT family N-acetyltransferase [Gaiellaceae bacterium]
MNVFTVAERPDLAEPAWEVTKDVFPEYNNHGDVLNEYWSGLTEKFPEFQFHLVDDDEQTLARARCLPVRWDGTVDDLPAGIDGAIRRGIDEGGGNALCAMVIQVPRALQSRGLSTTALKAMADIGRAHGLPSLIAPVRPNWKDRYPLIPIERYAEWRRGDGLPFDPWLRVHERVGASILRPEPESLRITGPVDDWEKWVGMSFPEDGLYVFPGGLAPLTVEAGTGRYWEPNVWMHHPL